MHRAKHRFIDEVFCEETGNTLLETSLCLSLVLLVILGVMECSLAVYTEHYVEWAASAGARYASVRGSTYSSKPCGAGTSNYCETGTSDIQNYIQTTAAPGLKSSNISVTASWSSGTAAMAACDTTQGNDSPGCIVTVTVTYPFSFMLPAPFNKSGTLTASRSIIISQ